MRILGIDPGSRLTGFGVIEVNGDQVIAIQHGVIKAGTGEFPERLGIIFAGIRDLIGEHQPGEVAIETVFMSRKRRHGPEAGTGTRCGDMRGDLPGFTRVRICTSFHQTGHRRPGRSRQGAGSAHGDGVVTVERETTRGRRRRAGCGIMSPAHAADPEPHAKNAKNMIARLAGTLIHKQPPLMVIDIAGVGYEVEAPLTRIL